ncbi:hypothetical protein KQI89_14025 [Clostridium sp. MSJ-4]|uniref:Lantibiotic n=1 Tax=Clostridium simiarum TaxID=2841506 RepID=A0ABS6F5S9_9CLOT|nr:hypothetical protein [Clostridium simiarum]MBU5592867.1 hypothetical protein [Clostridium simiarum]
MIEKLNTIDESLLKDSEEHGYEEYTTNVFKEKVLISFGNSCGCGRISNGNLSCGCRNKK